MSTAPARRLQLAAYGALAAAAAVPGHGSRSAVLPAAMALFRRGAQDASPELAALSSQVSRGGLEYVAMWSVLACSVTLRCFQSCAFTVQLCVDCTPNHCDKCVVMMILAAFVHDGRRQCSPLRGCCTLERRLCRHAWAHWLALSQMTHR